MERRLLENPALQLTAIYFMQEMRRQEKPQPTEELKELQEELLAHYSKGSFIVATQEDRADPASETEKRRHLSAHFYRYAGVSEICQR